MTDRSFTRLLYGLLAISVFLSVLVCYLRIDGSFATIAGLDLAYILKADRLELAQFYPNAAIFIYIFSRSFLLWIPSIALFSFIKLRQAEFRKELTPQNLGLFGIIMLVSLASAELALRIFGYVPSLVRTSVWVNLVDELKELDGFKSDKLGLFVIDTAIVHQISTAVTAGNNLEDLMFSFKSSDGGSIMPEVVIVFMDHLEIYKGNDQSEFGVVSQRLKHSKTRDKFDSLVYHYSLNPINQHGFYSIPFERVNSYRPKVLMLGDSFTWGHSTSSKTNSFCNNLLARGMVVYNTGISGADVPQYKLALETFIDSVKPDVAVLNFYVGNDVVYFERSPEPGVPLHYSTNAGNLMAFQDGETKYTAQDAYRGVFDRMRIPQSDIINRLCSKTAMTTLLWSGLYNLGVVKGKNFSFPARPTEIPVCNKQILDMMQICADNDVKFILSVIPNLNGNMLEYANSVPHLFENILYHEPEMSTEHYVIKDGHFNDSGHAFYADYLERLIQAELDRSTQEATPNAK